MESSERLEAHMERIQRHYCHACEKHPGFVERLTSRNMNENDALCIESLLRCLRKKCDKGGTAEDVLAEELVEQELALAKGDYQQAIEETYDAIAVLMRMAEMMEVKK